MNKRSLAILLLCLTASLTFTGCTRASMRQQLQTVSTAQGGPIVLAAYQPWFGQKNHIDVGYSSQDPQVLTKQIAQARDLGIDGFVVNWYGARKEFEDKAYGVFQEVANREGFKTAIMYDEDVDTPGPTTDKVIVDLQYAYDRYISPHAQVPNKTYLRYNGKPVIFIFPKQGNTDWKEVRRVLQSWEDPPLLIYKYTDNPNAEVFDGFYAWVHPGKAGWSSDGSNWGEQYLETFYKRMTNEFPNKLAIGAAWPGFDDSRAAWTQNRKMNARCGKTFTESLRAYRRYYSGNNALPYMMVVTWNDYEEGTAIERGISTCSGDDKQQTQVSAK